MKLAAAMSQGLSRGQTFITASAAAVIGFRIPEEEASINPLQAASQALPGAGLSPELWAASITWAASARAYLRPCPPRLTRMKTLAA